MEQGQALFGAKMAEFIAEHKLNGWKKNKHLFVLYTANKCITIFYILLISYGRKHQKGRARTYRRKSYFFQIHFFPLWENNIQGGKCQSINQWMERQQAIVSSTYIVRCCLWLKIARGFWERVNFAESHRWHWTLDWKDPPQSGPCNFGTPEWWPERIRREVQLLSQILNDPSLLVTATLHWINDSDIHQ